MDKFIELHYVFNFTLKSGHGREKKFSLLVDSIVSVVEEAQGCRIVYGKKGFKLSRFYCVESYDEVMALINGSAM